jgi:hypothetical protein
LYILLKKQLMKKYFILSTLFVWAFAACDSERRQERILRKTIKDYAQAQNLRMSLSVGERSMIAYLRDVDDFYFDYELAEEFNYFLRLEAGQSLAVSLNGGEFINFQESLREDDNGEYPKTYALAYQLPNLNFSHDADTFTLRLIAGDTLYMGYRSPPALRLRDYSPRPFGRGASLRLIFDDTQPLRDAGIILNGGLKPRAEISGGDASFNAFFTLQSDTSLVVGGNESGCPTPPYELRFVYNRVDNQRHQLGGKNIELILDSRAFSNTLQNVELLPWCAGIE